MDPQPHIVCDPNPFCYGSISALRALARYLPEVRLTVLATGAAREQCDEATFAQVLPCDVKAPESVARHAPVLASADAYLAISNNTNIPLALELGLPVVFVDILYWMKRRVTLAMRHADSYIIENFPGVSQVLELYGRELPRPLVVGPLIAPPSQRERTAASAHLLVNYGGAQSPDIIPGENTCYPSSMTRLLRELLPAAGWPPEHVTLATGAKAVASIHQQGLARGLRVETLPHARYLDVLAASSQLLTAPGLNAPFEGFSQGVPTCFLPPQNLTQVCQLSVYQEHGLAPRGLNLTELYPGASISAQAPEAEGTARILELVSRFDTDPEARSHVAGQITAQLRRGPEQLQRQLRAQEDFQRLLGPPGAEQAAEEIRRVLSTRLSRKELRE
jgi:hypothetical protein